MLNVPATPRKTRKTNTPITSPETTAMTASFTIRKNVPMPETANRGGGKAKYPWAAMSSGDMFFVPGAKIETFYTMASTARKKYGKNFKAAKFEQDGVQGIGVWCL